MKGLLRSLNQIVVIATLFLNTSLMTNAGDCCGAPTLITNLCAECPPGSCTCAPEACVCPEIQAYGSWVLRCTDPRVITSGESILFNEETVTPVNITKNDDGSGGSEFVFAIGGVYEISVGGITTTQANFEITGGSLITSGFDIITNPGVLIQKTMLVQVLAGETLAITLMPFSPQKTMCDGSAIGDQAVIMFHLVNPNAPIPPIEE